MQPTASRTDLLLRCARPFHPKTEVAKLEATDAMKYGSCVHGLLECALTEVPVPEGFFSRWGVTDVAAATAHVEHVVACLREWCKAEGNPFKEEFRVVDTEVPLATNVLGKTAKTRPSEFDVEAHVYTLLPGEVGGTFDVLLESPSWMVVLDLKTGDYGVWTEPAKLGQMQTLVMQCRPKWGRGKKWGAAILHAPAYGIPVVYAEEVTEADSKKHLKMLGAALSRHGDGSLTPGDWCYRCPAREGCPADDGALLARSGALVKMSAKELVKEAVEPGAAHMFLQQFEVLAERLREALRAEVAAGRVIMRPDGKTLILRRQSGKETLSKGGIVKALGKQAGEELIAELRQRGCVVVGEDYDVLVAVDAS